MVIDRSIDDVPVALAQNRNSAPSLRLVFSVVNGAVPLAQSMPGTHAHHGNA
jgi:hypothetical protein